MADEFNTPQSRNEAILQNILGATNDLPEPQSRIEELLQEILEQGSGEVKKYQHNILIDLAGSIVIRFLIISDDPAAMDYDDVFQYLSDNAPLNVDPQNRMYGVLATGVHYSSYYDTLEYVCGVGTMSGHSNIIFVKSDSHGNLGTDSIPKQNVRISDTVIEI